MVYRRDDVRSIDVRELLELASLRRSNLVARGVKQGDRVGILGPTHAEFIAWAFATWLAGATVVPLPSPIRVRDAEALRSQTTALTDAFECRVVIAHPRFMQYAPADLVFSWDDVDASLAPDASDGGREDDMAMIMCTSGSTALPKGVGLTHRKMLGRPLNKSLLNQTRLEKTRSLSFLPLTHAGGSTAMLSVLSRGTEAHIMAPELFARDPSEWLRLAQRIEATSIAGPSSAWAAALDAAQRRPEGLDLSRIGRAMFSMEMIDADIVERLIEQGAEFGLREEVVGLVYGMSEGGSTSTMPGEPLQFDVVDLDELVLHGRAVPANADTAHTKRIACCGRATSGLELRAMGPDGALPDREIGELQFRGPYLMQSYVGPAAEDTFDGEWLRTGDLGYLIDGQVYVTGRVKELIVHLGRKYHPEDIERAAAQAAGVLAHECVAFSPLDGAEGDVVIAIEVDDAAPDLEALVRSAVTSGVGIVPSAIVFVPKGNLPKAANGKQQRLAARSQYASGILTAR